MNKQQSFKASFKDIYNKYIVWDENNIKGFFEQFRYLSNFHICDVWFEGLLYPSSEHAYMASKSLDYKIRNQLSKNPQTDWNKGNEPIYYRTMTCAEARKFGQTIKLRDNWENIKYDMMLAVVFDKFWRNKDIQKLLLETGDKYLEETNHGNGS